MRVRVHEDLHVRRAETQLFDVREDERCRLRQSAIDEDGAGGRVDENRRETRRADVVRVTEDAERLERLVPARAGLAVLRWIDARGIRGRCGRRQQGGSDREATAEDRKSVV